MVCKEGVLDGTESLCRETSQAPAYGITDDQCTGKYTCRDSGAECDGQVYLPKVFKGIPRESRHNLSSRPLRVLASSFDGASTVHQLQMPVKARGEREVMCHHNQEGFLQTMQLKEQIDNSISRSSIQITRRFITE